MLPIVAILVACTKPEEYPDAWTRAAEVCSPEVPIPFTTEAVEERPSEDCAAVLREDLGDPDDYLVPAAALLFRFDLDPWLYDMAAANVEAVDFDWYTDDPNEAASYDLRSGLVTVHRLDDDPISQVMILVHEAGHGRPHAPKHSRCEYGPEAGEKVCDRSAEGANGAALEALEALHDLQGDPWTSETTETLVALARGRIE